MKYGLFVRGHLLRLTSRLSDILTSRAYEPWNPSTEIWEFKYNSNSKPVSATRI